MSEQQSIRHALQVAIGSVLFNAMNYPEAVQARILGQDTKPLNNKLTDVLEPMIRRIQADAWDRGQQAGAKWGVTDWADGEPDADNPYRERPE